MPWIADQGFNLILQKYKHKILQLILLCTNSKLLTFLLPDLVPTRISIGGILSIVSGSPLLLNSTLKEWPICLNTSKTNFCHVTTSTSGGVQLALRSTSSIITSLKQKLKLHNPVEIAGCYIKCVYGLGWWMSCMDRLEESKTECIE